MAHSHSPAHPHLHAHADRRHSSGTDVAHGNLHSHHRAASLNRTAWLATLHCLSGCAIGEVAGMAIGTALGWGNGATVALAVGLAFLSGYALTMLPLLRAGRSFAAASRIALAADTASILVMELVDNTVMMTIPGAMDAPLDSPVFWGSLVFSLAVAAVAAFPLNRWLIARGQGHAIAHSHH